MSTVPEVGETDDVLEDIPELVVSNVLELEGTNVEVDGVYGVDVMSSVLEVGATDDNNPEAVVSSVLVLVGKDVEVDEDWECVVDVDSSVLEVGAIDGVDGVDDITPEVVISRVLVGIDVLVDEC